MMTELSASSYIAKPLHQCSAYTHCIPSSKINRSTRSPTTRAKCMSGCMNGAQYDKSSDLLLSHCFMHIKGLCMQRQAGLVVKVPMKGGYEHWGR